MDPDFDDTLTVRLYAREALDRALAASGFTSVDEVCEHRTPQGLESWLVLAAAIVSRRHRFPTSGGWPNATPECHRWTRHCMLASRAAR